LDYLASSLRAAAEHNPEEREQRDGGTGGAADADGTPPLTGIETTAVREATRWIGRVTLGCGDYSLSASYGSLEAP
jgi:hypothetical protein